MRFSICEIAMNNIYCGRFNLAANKPIVMGIVNVTPDSFSDGGKFNSLDRAYAHAMTLVESGAQILDIGGESTRPGSESVSAEVEIDRVLPLLHKLRDVGVPLSLDTNKTEVMKVAIADGVVDIINDVNALEADGAVDAVLNSKVAVCLMHKKGTPKTMQEAPAYYDVVNEVCNYLLNRVSVLEKAGFPRDSIWIDPGFGFGKTLEHNIELMKEMKRFLTFSLPVLVGVSRKTMIGQMTGLPVEKRVTPSVVAALIAAKEGAHILRVHDVEETVSALKVWEMMA